MTGVFGPNLLDICVQQSSAVQPGEDSPDRPSTGSCGRSCNMRDAIETKHEEAMYINEHE